MLQFEVSLGSFSSIFSFSYDDSERLEKCFWSYHVTHQPIDIKRVKDVSVTPRWVIRKNKLTKSLKSPLRKKFDLMSISWPSDRIFCKPMQNTSVFKPREPRKMIEINIFWTSSKWSLAKIFWTPSIMNPLMTSRAWFLPKLIENSEFRCRPNI